MADDEGTTQPDGPARGQDGATQDADGQQQQQQPDLPPEYKRALAKANKEAEQLRVKLKAFEDRDKSEAEKLVEAKATAERAAADAQAELLRYRVAATKKLPPELADRLRGSTEEELAADADQLLALVGGKPPADFDGGARGGPPGTADMNTLIRQAAGLG